MRGDYHRRTRCRLCESGQLSPVLSLSPTPPANAFVGESELDRPQRSYPLDLHLCQHCGHLQLVDVVDPELLFSEYVYVSGTSPVFVRHFRDYAAEVTGRFDLGAGAFAVDIGSNDGVLLSALRERGLAVLGVDPARAIAARATAAGIPTRAEFFTRAVARRIRDERGGVDLVTANNVFAHSDDLREIAAGVRELLVPRGVFVLEVSYLVDVYEKNLFDTIYHEHLAYHALRPMLGFFARNQLDVFDAERVETHGGSLRVYVQSEKGGRARSARVADLVALEERLGLFEPATFRGWGDRIEEQGAALRARLTGLRDAGRRIAGYGAPAKATTLMHQFGLDRSLVEFVIDDSPWKQGLYTPGLHLPVLGPAALDERRPDCLLLLAWNFADPIIARHRAFLEGGGMFVVPLPRLRTVGPGWAEDGPTALAASRERG